MLARLRETMTPMWFSQNITTFAIFASTAVYFKLLFSFAGKPDPDPKPEPSEKCQDKHGNPISTGPFEKPGDCDHFYQVGDNTVPAKQDLQ